jgi:transposase
MKNIKEILRLASAGTFSARQIAKSCNCSPSTVTAILERAKNAELGMDWPLINQMSDDELEAKLYPDEHYHSERPIPDMNFIHSELKKKGVTLQLLWQEYLEHYPDGLGYSQFCDYYQKWRGKRNLSMHQIHKAGEKTYVDWVGPTMKVIDRCTGEILPAYLFVGVLGASELFYTEALPSMDMASWITAHVHMFEYFGGTTEILVPDNLKTGVKQSCYYSPEIHPTYLEMARHYGMAVIPARVRKPKDKSLAEYSVQLVERWIMAKHRDDTYFSFHELNRMIRQELDAANDRPFQKMEGSRRSVFEQAERHMLHPLPRRPYELAEFKEARVAPDYHVEYKGNFYSVPYRFVKDTVEIRATAKTIEVLRGGKRIAAHSRILPDDKHRYNTIPDHMPESHRFQAEWTPERLIQWADKIGPDTSAYINVLLSRRQHPEQSFRLCLGILKFADKYGRPTMERACRQAKEYRRYSYKDFKILIETLPPITKEPEEIIPFHQNIRGKEYFRQVVNGGVNDAD